MTSVLELFNMKIAQIASCSIELICDKPNIRQIEQLRKVRTVLAPKLPCKRTNSLFQQSQRWIRRWSSLARTS